MMINVTNNSIYRIPVGMNVCNIHKNGNHQTTIMKIFMLIYFLYHNDTTIGSSLRSCPNSSITAG